MAILWHDYAATLELCKPQGVRLIIRINDNAVAQALVIYRSFFGVGKQLVCPLDRIEPAFCARMRASVRVVAHRQRAICLFDLLACRGRRNAKDMVKIFQKVSPVRLGGGYNCRAA